MDEQLDEQIDRQPKTGVLGDEPAQPLSPAGELDAASGGSAQLGAPAGELEAPEGKSEQPDSVTTTSPDDNRIQPKTRALTVALVMASFATSFAGSSLNVSIPSIGAEFAVPTATLGWLLTAFTMCSVAFTLPLGRLGDLYSRRTLLMVGIAIFSLANLTAAFVPSMQVMLTLRFFQGIGGACMFATNQAILIDAYPPNVRGRVLGISMSAVYFGLAAGPIVGGFITQHLSWRAVFIFMAALGIITFCVAIGRLPKNASRAEPGQIRKNLDIPGMIFYMLGIVSLAWGLNNLPKNILAYVFVGVGLLLIGAFILWENRATSPLLNPRLFKAGWSFALSNLSAFFNFSSTFAVSYLMSIYLQQVKGFGADISGFILVTAPLTQATVTLFAGRFSDRYSPFRLASIGCGFCSLALISFIFVGPESPLLHIFINLILMGIGFGFFASPNTNAVMSLVPRQDFGTATAFLGTMRNLGQIVGMSVIVIITTIYLQDQPINTVAAADLSQVIKTCFMVFSIICLTGVFTSLQHKIKKPVEGSKD